MTAPRPFAPAPRSTRPLVLLDTPLDDLAAFAALAVALVHGVLASAEGLGYHWQWYAVPRTLLVWDGASPVAGPLLQGLFLTLELAAAALPLTFLLGLAACLLALSDSWTARAASRLYLETVRNTPLLIQIFVIWFVAAPLLDLPRFASGVLALALFEGAYAAEIMRGAVLSLPRGQWEAAHALGLTRPQAYARVILPQALRRALPSLTSQAVSLVKDSALLSTISIFELSLRAQALVSDTFLTFEIWFTVAGLYLVVNLALSAASRVLERRMRQRG